MALRKVGSIVDFDDALLAIRSPRTRTEILHNISSAIADVNAGKADRILLAARRMTCVYALLAKQGLVPPHRTDPDGRPVKDLVVSDRFIELLPDGAWAGERVILLDDTKVTGKTISARTHSAQRLVGKSGTVEERIAIDLSKGGKSKETLIDLHNQFAMAFGSNLLPFFTDFAMSTEIGVTARQLDRVLADPHWKTVDVTNSVLAGNGSRAFSLFVVDGLAETFLASIGAVGRLVDVSKIRMFVDDNFGALRLRVVPIVLTKSLSRASLESWLGTIGVERNGSDEQAAHAAGLVSILLSRALFATFAEYSREAFGLDLVEDAGLTDLALGSEIARIAAMVDLATLELLEFEDVADSGEPVHPTFDWPGSDNAPESHYIIAGDDAVRVGFEKIQTLRSAKERTTTLGEVAELSGRSVAVSSVAIDILNDLGYSVPLFAIDGEMVVRSYRAGEAEIRFEDLMSGRLGGRLASLSETFAVPNEEYFDEDNFRSTSEPAGTSTDGLRN